MTNDDDYNWADDAYKSWELAIKALRLKHVAEGKDVPRNEEERNVAEEAAHDRAASTG